MKQDVLYQILTTAEDCQTVSDIAKKLFLSQPYVSQVLSKAEKNTMSFSWKEEPCRSN